MVAVIYRVCGSSWFQKALVKEKQKLHVIVEI